MRRGHASILAIFATVYQYSELPPTNPQPTVGHAFLPQVVQTSQNYMRQIVAVELVWVRPMLTKLETLDAERLMVRSHR